MTKRAAIAAIFGLVWASVAAAQGLAVRDVKWGFDGKLPADGFGQISVLLVNTGGRAFDDRVALRRGQDASLEEAVFLAPGSERWVQFYVYGVGDSENVKVVWRGGGEVLTREEMAPLAEVKRSGSAIFLEEGRGLSAPGGALKRFPEALFPSSITGTDGLSVVVLDHAPRWDEARRTAFLEWLTAGGRCVLLHGADGKHPDFSEGLAALNGPLEAFPVGAGFVRKLPMTVASVSKELAAAFVEDGGAVMAGGALPGDPPAEEATEGESPTTPGKPVAANSFPKISAMDLLIPLKRMTTPDHNWPLIHLIAWAYIGSVFPGAYFVGRKPGRAWLMYSGLLAMILAVSVAFAAIGRRGYGESTVVHTVALAKPCGEGVWDVREWSDAFVTAGGEYWLSHEGTGDVYATGLDMTMSGEWVNGMIVGGRDGGFLADIPPFSSRGFLHRMRAESPTPHLKVTKWKTLDGVLREAELTIDTGEMSLDPKGRVLVLAYGKLYYHLARSGTTYSLLEKTGTPSADLAFQVQSGELVNQRWRGWNQVDDKEPRDVRLMNLCKAAVIASLGGMTPDPARVQPIPNGRARVYLNGPLPKAWETSPKQFPQQHGEVIYQLDFPVSETEPVLEPGSKPEPMPESKPEPMPEPKPAD